MNNMDAKLILYKYISFSKFIDLIENERLYMTRVDLWEDTHEGASFIENFGFDMPKEIRELMGDRLQDILMKNCIKSMYAQSWTDNNIETDAMWRIYSADKIGVRIAVEAKSIKDEINNSAERLDSSITVNNYRVEYGIDFNFDDVRTTDGIGVEWNDEAILKHKREAFSHEREYRFSFSYKIMHELDKIKKERCVSLNQLSEYLDNIQLPPVIYYDLKNSMIKEVILDPRASEYDTEMFKKYCENRDFKGKNIEFKKSTLYDKPINQYFNRE